MTREETEVQGRGDPLTNIVQIANDKADSIPGPSATNHHGRRPGLRAKGSQLLSVLQPLFQFKRSASRIKHVLLCAPDTVATFQLLICNYPIPSWQPQISKARESELECSSRSLVEDEGFPNT